MALRRDRGVEVSRLCDLHEKWLEEPAYGEEYERLGPEFELARALIGSGAGAGLTQAELADGDHDQERGPEKGSDPFSAPGAEN